MEIDITIYTLPNCVQCDVTKRKLKEHNVPYKEVDLSTDEEASNMVKELGYTSAPVVVVDGRHWSGFKLEKIKELIR